MEKGAINIAEYGVKGKGFSEERNRNTCTIGAT